MTDLQDASGATAAASNPLQDRLFTATVVTENGAPRPLVPGTTIDLAFGVDRLGASGGCNALSFDLQVGAVRLTVGEATSTLMACDEARMAQDAWLSAFLTAGPDWVLRPGCLLLSGGDVLMELAERPAPPLWGTTFDSFRVTERGIVPAPVVEGTTISLTFTAPDGLTAEAGCNTLGLRVRSADGGRLDVDDRVSSTRMACTPELTAQDEWLTALLVAGPDYTLTSGALTLVRGGTTVALAPRVIRPS